MRQQRQHKQNKTGRRWWWVALPAAAALLLAAAAVGVWQQRGHQPPTGEEPAAPAATAATTSNTVRVTVPEGYTVEQIAALLEESGACTAAQFREAVQHGDFPDYPFVAQIPLTGEDGTDNGRLYRLEGYLFPDTYEFYRNGGGEAAVTRFLQNFANKMTAWQTALEQCGLTLDEAVTLASIIQKEAKHDVDMPRVSRVLHNRLDSPDYPCLQCDATTKYRRDMAAAGWETREDAYDSYVCRGLPVGAIGNPGLAALTAAVAPSEEEICAGCYFFVTDDANDTVYYSKTYAEHVAVCRQLGLTG